MSRTDGRLGLLWEQASSSAQLRIPFAERFPRAWRVDGYEMRLTTVMRRYEAQASSSQPAGEEVRLGKGTLRWAKQIESIPGRHRWQRGQHAVEC